MSGVALIEASPGELRAALVEAGQAVELLVERAGSAGRLGEIHLGRVVRLLPALPAAHVDIGGVRPAFLSAEDAVDCAAPEQRAAGIAHWLHEGQALLVQVTREAQGDKAPGVSARLRLAGRLMALTPTRAKLVAPRGAAPDIRQRLEALLAGALPAGAGAVLAPAALTAPPEALLAELAALALRWSGLRERARQGVPPALLESEDEPLARLLAQIAAWRPERILVDQRACFAGARAWLVRHRPDLAERAALDVDESALLERHGIAAAFDAALAPRVALPGGGALIVEATAAMSVIDVDGGGAVKRRGDAASSIVAVNLAAAAEAARQIRLRNLAGAIVVDFISMKRRGDRDRVLAAFAAALALDPAAPQLLGWTRLGHVELTRRRRHPPLAELLGERRADGGWAASALTLALAALRHAARQAARHPAGAPVLAVHPEIAAALAGPALAARDALAAELGRPVEVRADPALARETFDIRFA